MSKKERIKKIIKEIECLKDNELNEIENAVKACKIVQTLRDSEIRST